MDSLINAALFSVVDAPDIKISRPRWLELPSPMTTYVFVMITYFLVTAGTIYDVIHEPPSIGSTVDERGFQKPQAILPHRLNGQYIMEGLAASFMFSLGGIGFIMLDYVHDSQATRKMRLIFTGCGFAAIIISVLTIRSFMRVKMPGY